MGQHLAQDEKQGVSEFGFDGEQFNGLGRARVGRFPADSGLHQPNPSPATKQIKGLGSKWPNPFFYLSVFLSVSAPQLIGVTTSWWLTSAPSRNDWT
jgi:hypothetical protein